MKAKLLFSLILLAGIAFADPPVNPPRNVTADKDSKALVWPTGTIGLPDGSGNYIYLTPGDSILEFGVGDNTEFQMVPDGSESDISLLLSGKGAGVVRSLSNLVVGNGSSVVDFTLNSSGDTWFYQQIGGTDMSYFGFRESADAFVIGTVESGFQDRLTIDRETGHVEISESLEAHDYVQGGTARLFSTAGGGTHQWAIRSFVTSEHPGTYDDEGVYFEQVNLSFGPTDANSDLVGWQDASFSGDLTVGGESLFEDDVDFEGTISVDAPGSAFYLGIFSNASFDNGRITIVNADSNRGFAMYNDAGGSPPVWLMSPKYGGTPGFGLSKGGVTQLSIDDSTGLTTLAGGLTVGGTFTPSEGTTGTGAFVRADTPSLQDVIMLYGYHVDGANYERLRIDSTGGNHVFTAQAAGSGNGGREIQFATPVRMQDLAVDGAFSLGGLSRLEEIAAETVLSNNAYFDTGDDTWKHTTAAPASLIQLSPAGSIVLTTAVDGGAADPIDPLTFIFGTDGSFSMPGLSIDHDGTSMVFSSPDGSARFDVNSAYSFEVGEGWASSPQLYADAASIGAVTVGVGTPIILSESGGVFEVTGADTMHVDANFEVTGSLWLDNGAITSNGSGRLQTDTYADFGGTDMLRYDSGDGETQLTRGDNGEYVAIGDDYVAVYSEGLFTVASDTAEINATTFTSYAGTIVDAGTLGATIYMDQLSGYGARKASMQIRKSDDTIIGVHQAGGSWLDLHNPDTTNDTGAALTFSTQDGAAATIVGAAIRGVFVDHPAFWTVGGLEFYTADGGGQLLPRMYIQPDGDVSMYYDFELSGNMNVGGVGSVPSLTPLVVASANNPPSNNLDGRIMMAIGPNGDYGGYLGVKNLDGTAAGVRAVIGARGGSDVNALEVGQDVTTLYGEPLHGTTLDWMDNHDAGADQTISNSTRATVELNYLRVNTGGTASTSTERFTASRTGIVTVEYSLKVVPGSSGYYQVECKQNSGTGEHLHYFDVVSTNAQGPHGSFTMSATSGDTFELQIYNASGSTLTINRSYDVSWVKFTQL